MFSPYLLDEIRLRNTLELLGLFRANNPWTATQEPFYGAVEIISKSLVHNAQAGYQVKHRIAPFLRPIAPPFHASCTYGKHFTNLP